MNESDKTAFTEDETRTLSCLADMVIPASDEFGVPSAGDAAIMEAILTDAARQCAPVTAALAALEALSQDGHGTGFADLSPALRESVVTAFRETHSADAELIATLTVQAYYRDDRVMTSLGMEPRPPHPKGYSLEQGDWSLLDPVRKRAAFYRRL